MTFSSCLISAPGTCVLLVIPASPEARLMDFRWRLQYQFLQNEGGWAAFWTGFLLTDCLSNIPAGVQQENACSALPQRQAVPQKHGYPCDWWGRSCGQAIGFVFITMVVFSSANVGAWWFVIHLWRCKWNEKSISPWAARWVSVGPLQGQTAIRATRKGFNEVTWKVRVVILYDRMTECLCFYWEVSWSCG